MAMQTKAWMIGFLIFILDCILCTGFGDVRGHFSNKLAPSNPIWSHLTFDIRCGLQGEAKWFGLAHPTILYFALLTTTRL
jgi:hypothetical protein